MALPEPVRAAERAKRTRVVPAQVGAVPPSTCRPEPPHGAQEVRWVEPRQRRDVPFGVGWVLEVDGASVGLVPGGTYVLGRDETCDIRVTDAASKSDTVSRRHLG